METSVANTGFRLVNLYRRQAEIVFAAGRRPPTAVVTDLVRDVYRPYAEFWQGYLGDEAAFRSWAETTLLAPDHPIQTRIPALLALDLDSLIADGAAWVGKTTGLPQEGTWYIVFGPGWTDMGGLGAVGMVADFSALPPEAGRIATLLPHELTHVVHTAALRSIGDSMIGTVMERIVAEGLGTYASFVYARGTRTPAQSIGYTDDEWGWALSHERELIDAARTLLSSTTRADINRVASRRDRLVAGGPTAAGYFLGFRLIEAYAGRRGAGSWTETITLPVQEVLARAGYF